MGTFVDRLRACHGSTGQIPFDLGPDTPPAEPIDTVDVLCAVRLDAAGVEIAPGRIVAIYADKAAHGHFHSFMDSVGCPDAHPSRDALGCPKGGSSFITER